VRKKEKDRKNYRFDSYDLTTKQGKCVWYERRRKDEAKMRRLKYFNKEYEKEEFVKHGDYYEWLNNYLKDRPKGSNKSRIQIYEAEKRRKKGKSPIAK
jgi:hypothetical protein